VTTRGTDLPSVERLTLAVVTRVPPDHPDVATFEPFPVHAWVIRHPSGPILVDAGIGFNNVWIDEHFAPQRTQLGDALAGIGLSASDVVAVVVSHLHFDHCGQLDTLTAPVLVQGHEYEASQEHGYTVSEWATIAEDRLRLVDGDREIADGVRLLLTPGHTPGHQSVVVETAHGREVIAAQCAFRAEELREGVAAASNLFSPAWADTATASLERLSALSPARVHLSHDEEIVTL
jgi:N-acyl homoserine lactone hydrolase